MDQTPNRIEQTIDVAVSADDVWEAVTDPDALATWLGADVVLDVSVAGSGRVVDDDGTVRQLIVTDVQPAHRLAWHWWSDDGELSSVELTLEPLVDGTRVRVVEVLLPPAARSLGASAATASCRWSSALRALANGAHRFVPA